MKGHEKSHNKTPTVAIGLSLLSYTTDLNQRCEYECESICSQINKAFAIDTDPFVVLRATKMLFTPIESRDLIGAYPGGIRRQFRRGLCASINDHRSSELLKRIDTSQLAVWICGKK